MTAFSLCLKPATQMHKLSLYKIFNWPFNSQDIISNSPYFLPYNSYNISLENLELDQPIIP